MEALKTKRIAGAGIDVFDKEPPPANHPLLQFVRALFQIARSDGPLTKSEVAFPPKEGASANSYVALQNPTDAQWPRNGRVTISEHAKVKIT